MKTALVRTKENNLKTFRDDFYKTNSAMDDDLRGNGFKVLHIWNKDMKDTEVDEWEFLNRK